MSSVHSAAAPPPSLASASDYPRSEGVDSPPPLTEDDDGSDTDSMGGHDDDNDNDHPSERAVSPAASAYSYSSSVDSEFMLRELHGRTLNNTNAVSPMTHLRDRSNYSPRVPELSFTRYDLFPCLMTLS